MFDFDVVSGPSPAQAPTSQETKPGEAQSQPHRAADSMRAEVPAGAPAPRRARHA